MQGKHIAITGPTAGIGRAAALELAGRGARVTLLCRSRDKGEQLQAEIDQLGGEPASLVMVDLGSLESVRDAARELLAGGAALDVLLNNAGVVNTRRKETVDGFEETLAVNHLAPFLMTGLLLPAIRRSPAGRIVTVSSHAHTFVRDMGFDDLQAEHSYRTFREYGRSKLANILFTRRLAQRLEGEGITANCLHPGAVATSLGTNNGVVGKLMTGILKPFFRSPQRGAQTSVYLCAAEEVAQASGGYYYDCKAVRPKPPALDDDAAQRLWAVSEELTGFNW